jgi:hypothetical protein
VLAGLGIGLPGIAHAQHDHTPSPAAGPIPEAQAGSGTAWLPAAAPIGGYHARRGRWSLMAHGSAFLQLVYDFGTRRDYQLGSVNWAMAGAAHPLAGGTVGIRAMLSAEALTVTGRGYPQLLQVAQPYRRVTLTDRMHPHELVGEAAVTYDHGIGAGLAGSLYLAAVGEPALGPVSYRHRPSAIHDPAAPLGLHSQDFTHTSFGVATAGVYTRRVRLEGSVFNGAHPDDVRTNFDFAGARLNSYAARLTVNPDPRWSVAAWGGYLAASGGTHAHGASHRIGLALLRSTPSGPRGTWSTALIWGADVPTETRRALHSILLESSLEPGPSDAFLGRAEYVRRTAADLALVGSVRPELDLGALSLGYARRLQSSYSLEAWLGLRGTINFVPEDLRLFYGSRTPLGVIAYVQVTPSRRADHLMRQKASPTLTDPASSAPLHPGAWLN